MAVNISGPKQIFRVDRPDAIMPWNYRIRFAHFAPAGWSMVGGIDDASQQRDRLIVAKPVEMIELKDDEHGFRTDPGPMLCDITREGLQSLMDELWNAGIRPSDIGTPGHISTMKAHLDDMRSIVAQQLRIPLPGVASQT